MFKLHKPYVIAPDALLSSMLYDQDSFYSALLDDLRWAKSQVIVESPFITTKRIESLLPIFGQLKKRGVQIVVNTKPLNQHEPNYYVQAEAAISALQAIGVLILFTVGHHRKLVIIDECGSWA
jgi:phosphatidylserine/phosphatidylglycerophosphate/cardiolipin synthase-like enzyme